MIKEIIKYLGWVFFFILLWCNGCSSSSNETYSTPVVEKVFTKTKNIYHTLIDTIYIEKLNNNEKIINDIYSLYKENESLKEAFKKEVDSFKRIEMYNKAVSLNAFSSSFEDENIEITIDGMVQGQVKNISPTYIIKPRKIKEKEVVFRLLGGIGAGNTYTMDKPVFYANLGFQIKKGNIIRASYDSEKRIVFGYDFSIFTIKK